MRNIHLDNVIPSFLEGLDPGSFNSEVWGSILSFEKGHSYLVKAASGRGKTTLCSFILGIRSDFRGKISFDERNISSLSEKDWATARRRAFSPMFQSLMLFDELTPMENIRIKPMSSSFTDKEIKDMLARVGLEDKINTKAGKMSFGQRQRAAFVRMLCQEADFLIMDEPVSHLDDANCSIMSEMIRERCLRDGAGIIVTSIGRELPYEYDKEVNL